MKRLFALLLCITLTPLLFATEHAEIDISRTKYDATLDKDVLISPAKPPAGFPDSVYVTSFPAPGTGSRGCTFDGTDLWIADDGGTLYKVDAATGAILGSWPAPGGASACGFAWDGTHLWLSHYGTNTVYEIDPATMAVMSQFTVPGSMLFDLAYDGTNLYGAFGNAAYILGFTTTGVVIDSIHATYSSGNVRPFGLCHLSTGAGELWTCDGGYGSDMVNLWDFGTSTWFDQWSSAPATYPCGLAYDPVSGLMWITCWSTNQVYVWDVGPTGGGAVLWDFETGLQAWTHTNGMPFPAGWDVEPSGTHASQTPPAAGDSCFWIDSDAGGSALWMQDSALSPVCTPGASMDWLKYGFCNYGGSGSYINELHVGIKHSTGGVWTATELAFYPSGVTTGPAWDSVDVSAYASADFVQVYFYFDDLNTWGYWSSFDNVEIDATPYVADHDVGCSEIVSPPEGPVAPANYDVIGRIRNFGNTAETFDVVAHVYDTVGMNLIFDQTINLALGVGGDTNLDFGQVTFDPDKYFYTEIYTMLGGDSDPSNDTSSVESRTAVGLGDVIFELDAQGSCTDNQLLGIEFDGERFYITGGGNAADPNKVYVVDTAGTLLWALDQPAHSTGWGWRDIAWDDVYVGPDRIDTLYASVNTNVDKFSIDLTGGVLTYHGFSPGAQNPNRALAYKPDSGWFYTANFSSSCYKFDKSGVIVQSVPNTLAMYGAAYDPCGGYVWWHSQDDPGTGFLCQITQMDAQTMTFTGVITGFAMPAALTDAIAGGLCYYEGFRGNMDVLFALLQGTPNDYIVGILVRTHPGVEGKPGAELPSAFGFAPSMATVSRGRMPVAYSTTAPGHVSLKVYDGMGRLVQTLVNSHQPAGEKSILWNNKDLNQRTVSNGVYFFKLEAENQTAVHKLILVH